MKELDSHIDKTAYIYGAIYSLSNRLQVLGDKLDPAISTKQWFVLAAISKLNEKIPNIGDVANLLGTSRQNVKKIAVILEKRGYLKLKKDSNDLRNIQLLLTENSLSYFKSRENQEDEYMRKIFNGIDEETLNYLCCGIKRLIENSQDLEKNDGEQH